MTSITGKIRAGVAVLSLAVATGCGGGGGSAGDAQNAEFDLGAADRQGTVVVGESLEFFTLDPRDVIGNYQRTMWAPIYDTLLRTSPEGELEPGLAESWEVVDNDTISLTLRSDVTFSDGAPVDTEALRANLLRMKEVDTGETNIVLQELKDVIIESPSEAVIELSSPAAGEFLQVLQGPESLMISPAAFDDPNIDVDQQAVGAGPYEVVSFEPEQTLVLERKDDHWDADNWPIKTIEVRQVPDGSPRVTALSAGDIQFTMSGDASVVPALENNPAVEVLTAPGQQMHYALFCKSRPPFDDPDVRRAFELAIDRSSLVDAVTAGNGAAAFQVWPEDSPNYNPDAVRDYDVDEAKELLGGRDIETNMSYVSFVPGHDRVGEIMQAQLAEVGIDLELNPTEAVPDALAESNDALLIYSTHQGVGRVARQLGPDSVNNLCGYNDPDFNALVDQIEALDPESSEANDAWHQVAELVNEDALMMPLFFQVNATAFQGSEIGAMPFTTPYVDFRYVYAK